MINSVIHKPFQLGSLIAIVAVAISLYLHWSGIWRELECLQRTKSGHPIDTLIRQAEVKLNDILLRATDNLEEATAAYKKRRNKDPPEGFERWFELARTSSAFIVEDFFDPIYTDLRDLDGIPGTTIRATADAIARTESAIVRAIVIKNGNVTCNCQEMNRPCFDVRDMFAKVAPYLPDMTIPINGNASPRIVVPHGFENNRSGNGIKRLESGNDHLFVVDDWRAFWPKACPPDTRIWSTSESNDHELVTNVESWRNVCQQPWLAKMHGALVRPLAQIVGQTPLPLFSPARAAGIERGIRYPDAIYWTKDEDYHAGTNVSANWASKQNKAIWRGTNSGGGHDAENWHEFHRHRFVAFTNSTYLRSVAAGKIEDWAGFLKLPSMEESHLQMAEEYFDTGFSVLTCRDDYYRKANRPCSYTDSHFRPVPWMSLDELLTSYRYVFDIDGNSFSGRFHALLLSESVVLKATIYEEWHDTRIVPWLHFVPLSNAFGRDVWTVMEYFLTHEDKAAAMARSARSWSLKVLRREDMELYLLRLLLEWARLLET